MFFNLVGDERREKPEDGVDLLGVRDLGLVLENVLGDEDGQRLPAVEVEELKQGREVREPEHGHDVVEVVDRDLQQFLQLAADRCQVLDPAEQRRNI